MVVASFKYPTVHIVKMDFKMLPWVQNLLHWQLLQWHMEQPLKLQDISLFIHSTVAAETSLPTCKKWLRTNWMQPNSIQGNVQR